MLLLLFFIVFCFFVEGGWLVVILFFWKTVPHFYIDIYQYIQYTNSRPPHDSWIVITTKFCSIRQVFTLRMAPVSIQNENEFTFKTSCQSIPQYFIILVNIGLDRGCYWNTNVQRTQCQGNNSGVCQAKRKMNRNMAWIISRRTMNEAKDPPTRSSRTCIPRTQALTSRPCGEALPAAPHLTQVKDQYNKNSASYNSYICLYKMEK